MIKGIWTGCVIGFTFLIICSLNSLIAFIRLAILTQITQIRAL